MDRTIEEIQNELERLEKKIGEVKRKAYREETYWARPVPGFGDINARVMVVGLAPGAHGSNRTGRMFTGDDSGNFLYPALFEAGFASQPTAAAVDDGYDAVLNTPMSIGIDDGLLANDTDEDGDSLSAER